jgi:hypothetical protein
MPGGRPERELDLSGGPIPAFAAQLRALREQAGRPSYRDLARKACYSRTALSQAAAGRELPSLAVTLAFVRACDGPVEVWRRRWQGTAAAVGSTPAPETPLPETTPRPEMLSSEASSPGTCWPDRQSPGTTAAPGTLETTANAGKAPPGAGKDDRPAQGRPVGRPPAARRTFRRVRVLLVVAVVAAAVVAGGWLIGSLRTVPAGVLSNPPNDGSSAAGTPGGGPIVDGAPPGRNHCDADTAVLGSADLRVGTGAMIGRLELRFSARCAVAWARLVPSGGVSDLAGITMTITRRPDGTVMGARGLTPAGRLHTDVVRLPPGTCAQAQVSLTRPGQPRATVATTCQPPHLPHAANS